MANITIAAWLRTMMPGMAALAGVIFTLCSCGNPLGIDTPRREIVINIDSIVSSPGFIDAPGDSIFALINGNEVVFTTEVLRPIFHNRRTSQGYYLAIRATRSGLNASDYEAMSLRMDAIRDTGTFAFNAQYSAPKQFDSTSAPKYGAAYDRKFSMRYPESYTTGTERSAGSVRIVKIDEERKVLVGTFEFKGYNPSADTVIQVDRGAFRLQLKNQ